MSDAQTVKVFVQGQAEPLCAPPGQVRGCLGMIWVEKPDGSFYVVTRDAMTMLEFCGMNEAEVEKAMAKITPAGR